MSPLRVLVAAIALCALLPGGAMAQAKPVAPAARPAWLSVQDLRTRFGDKQSHFERIAGLDVHYKDEGKGPAILLVHGSISSLKTWDAVADYLVRHHYRVVRYDLPGFGLSDAATDEAVKELKPVEIAETLLTRLKVTGATVVGVSSGGTLGVQLAAKRPDLVARLILSNAPSDPLSWSPVDPKTLPVSFSAALEEDKRLGFKTMAYWDAWFDHYSGRPGRYDRKFKEQIYYMMLREPDRNITSMIAQVADHDAAVKAMRAVRAPTLLLWGGADPLLPFAAMDKLASYLTGTMVSKLMMPDVGHYPPMEEPARYAELVRNYIENVVP